MCYRKPISKINRQDTNQCSALNVLCRVQLPPITRIRRYKNNKYNLLSSLQVLYGGTGKNDTHTHCCDYCTFLSEVSKTNPSRNGPTINDEPLLLVTACTFFKQAEISNILTSSLWLDYGRDFRNKFLGRSGHINVRTGVAANLATARNKTTHTTYSSRYRLDLEEGSVRYAKKVMS